MSVTTSSTSRSSTVESDRYDPYITQALEHHRVFVDIDVFMRTVLHVPDNWKELWGRTIRRIKRDKVFSIAHWDYSRQCGTQGVQEWTFYKPLVDMGNAILDISDSSPDGFVKPQTRQRHHGFLPHICSEDCDEARLNQSNLFWTKPFRALEAEPLDPVLVDGSWMPRLKVDGKPTTTSCGVIL